MNLQFPTSFQVCYPKENKNYYNTSKTRDSFERLLLDACEEYCMYCGKSLVVDGKIEFNIEHSLEKTYQTQAIEFLKHCKYNLSITCASCNQIYKKRMIESLPEKVLEITIDCKSKSCTNFCSEYRHYYNYYITLNKIILQPYGIVNKQSENLNIEYSLLKHIFKPSDNFLDETSDHQDLEFIREHISRFHLNREMFTDSVLKICEKICKTIGTFGLEISVDSVMELIEIDKPEHIIGGRFIEFLKDKFKDGTRSLLSFCTMLILIEYI